MSSSYSESADVGMMYGLAACIVGFVLGAVLSVLVGHLVMMSFGIVVAAVGGLFVMDYMEDP